MEKDKQIEYLTEILCYDCADRDECSHKETKCEMVLNEALKIYEAGFRIEHTGIWEYDEYEDCLVCSICGRIKPKIAYASNDKQLNFCPFCGTKMLDAKNTENKKVARWKCRSGWIGNHDKRIEDAICSECGYKHPTVCRTFNSKEVAQDVLNKLAKVCPGCGADMEAPL